MEDSGSVDEANVFHSRKNWLRFSVCSAKNVQEVVWLWSCATVKMLPSYWWPGLGLDKRAEPVSLSISAVFVHELQREPPNSLLVLLHHRWKRQGTSFRCKTRWGILEDRAWAAGMGRSTVPGTCSSLLQLKKLNHNSSNSSPVSWSPCLCVQWHKYHQHRQKLSQVLLFYLQLCVTS